LGEFGQFHYFEHALVSEKEGFVLRLPLKQTLPLASLIDEHPKRAHCVDELIASIPGLLHEDANLMRLDIDPTCFAATDLFPAPSFADLLATEPGAALRARLDDHLQEYPGTSMPALELAQRAGFAGTCTGCHVVGGSPWSNERAVSQVNRERMQACAGTGPDATRRCYARSPILDTIFLPHWTNVLSNFLQHPDTFGSLPGGGPSTTAIDGAPLPRRHR
jgi:hypothetical protein